MNQSSLPSQRFDYCVKVFAVAVAVAVAMVIGIGFTSAAQAGPILDRVKSRRQIVIAYRESSVPFSYVGADRKPVGYAVDLCRRLAEAVKRRLDLREMDIGWLLVSTSDRLPSILEGRADLECGSTTNTAERRAQVAFTVPHFITGTRYLVRADSPLEFLDQFRGKVMVSTKTTTPLKSVEKANRDFFLEIKIVEAQEHIKAVEMIERGEADGFAMDDVLLYGLIAGRPNPSALKVVGKFLTIEPLAIMFGKGDPEFKRVVDEEMRRLIYSREAYEIYRRWFQQPIQPAGVNMSLPMSYLLKDFWKFPTDKVPN